MEIPHTPPPTPTTYIIVANDKASQTFVPLKASSDLLLALNQYGSARLVITNAQDADLVVKNVVGRVDAELLKAGVPKRCYVEDWGRGVNQVTLVANESSEQ